MKRKEYQLLWPFYLTALISSSFSVAIPVWVIFFQTRFSFLQISLALSLQITAAILFEIPSGSVADVLGRKRAVIAGILLQGVLWLFLPFIRHDVLLYVVFFLMGASRTLESGADSAWMVDWLRENRQGGLVRDMFLKLHALRSAGAVIGSFMATILLFMFEAKVLFLIQGCGYIIESFILLRLAKERACRRTIGSIGNAVTDTLEKAKTGVHFVWRNKPMLYLLLGATCAVCSRDFGCVAWQPLLVDLELPVQHLGVVFAIAGILGIGAPLLAKVLLRALGQENLCLLTANAVELVLLLSLCRLHAPDMTSGVIIYLVVILVSDIQSPILSSYFQSMIPSRIRATVASVQSTAFAASSLVVTALGGYIMDRRGSRDAMVAISCLLIPAGLFYALANIGRSAPIRAAKAPDGTLPARHPPLFPGLKPLLAILSPHGKPSFHPLALPLFRPRRLAFSASQGLSLYSAGIRQTWARKARRGCRRFAMGH